MPSNADLIPQNGTGYRRWDLDQALAACARLGATYREVYGSDEKDPLGNTLWGEGANCNLEGRSRMITLPEFRDRQARGALTCDCGGSFEECYPDIVLRTRLTNELGSGEQGSHPFCTVLLDESTLNVTGFSWGAICTRDQLETRMLNRRPEEYSPTLVGELLRALDLAASDKLVFWDELAILREARQGGAAFRLLCRLTLEQATQHANRGIFFTARDSSLLELCTTVGWQPVLESGHLAFLQHRNLKSLLAMLQAIEKLGASR
jgi:hypothetical protein